MKIWNDFKNEGSLGDSSLQAVSYEENQNTSGMGETIGSAVCASVKIPAGKTINIPFVIAWDIPLVTFGSGRQWYRRYTKFFGRDGKNIEKIAKEAFEKYPEWEEAVQGFRKPILENGKIPGWLKTALFNELYYLADGGTFWDDGEVKPEKNPFVRYDISEKSHFAYLECFDYNMYNTFDVHFYSGFALAEFFPGLQKSVIRDFANAILSEDPEMRPIVLDKLPVMRKPFGLCPHDLGSPDFDPYFKINHYNLHDCANWKDLNSKFIIQVYFEILQNPDDSDFLKSCWPAVEAAMTYMEKFVNKDSGLSGSGLPENSGYPDQTYDTWTMRGYSSYCLGLWITANAAASRIASALGEKEKVEIYLGKMEKAKAFYEKNLFNSKYYLFDTCPENAGIVMADQLCGEFWARVLHLDEAKLEESHVKSSLRSIYENNVMRYGGGNLGAVNGMFYDGPVDESNLQSREVWTGTTYTLAALMLDAGMAEEAFQTAYGVYDTTYNHGYVFRTPEAWDKHRNYRATQYMRPLAVWSLWVVLKRLIIQD